MDQKTIQVVNRLKLRLRETSADLPPLSGPGDCIKERKNFITFNVKMNLKLMNKKMTLTLVFQLNDRWTVCLDD